MSTNTPNTNFIPSSYKRRSLQSPFIKNTDSLKADDDNDLQSELDEKFDVSTLNTSSIKPPISDFAVTNLNSSPNGSPLNNQFPNDSPSSNNSRHSRYSMYNIQNSSIPSSIIVKKNHRRSSSSASNQYTPSIQLCPRPTSPINRSSPTPLLNGLSTSPVRNNSPSSYQPFKFGSVMMNNSSESLVLPNNNSDNPTVQQTQVLPKPSYRRGHRYKHSSVSMNMFQEAPKSELNNLPKTYIIPNFEEVLSSITSGQKLKLICCILQAGLVLLSYIAGFHYGSICLSTLSHIVFYDLIGNLLVVVVQIMTNFEVWKNSSLKFPFGLGRIEVLIGFGLSVSLLFVGLDLLSHIVEEAIIGVVKINDIDQGGHSHHVHEGGENHMNSFIYEAFICLIIITTVVSSKIILKNTDNSKISDVDNDDDSFRGIQGSTKINAKRLSSITLKEPKKEPLLKRLGIKRNILSSSTTVLTLIYSAYCLYYPFVQDTHAVEWINQASTLLLALLIIIIGWRLIIKLGNTLILKSPFDGMEKRIIENIKRLDSYKKTYTIEYLLISKVNHKIFIVILKMKMIGVSDDDESKFRFYAMRIIKGLMYQAVNGELDYEKKSCRKKNDDEIGDTDDDDDGRRSLLDLLNLNSGMEYMDNSGEQFEITIDIHRL